MKIPLAVAVSLLAALLYAWPMMDRSSPPGLESATFVTRALPAPPEGALPLMVEEFISPDTGEGMVHVGSICELEDGRLLAAWYGGSREGAGDVAVFTAMKDGESPGAWTAPKRVVDRISASRELYRYIKKVGNPVIFTGSRGGIWLVYVTVSAGGWSGSSLNVKLSSDAGATWTRSRRLTLSPFFNISELVRSKPLPLENGGFALPVYRELLGYFPEILWMGPGRREGSVLYRKSRMAGGRSFIQPALVATGSRLATAFYRCRSEEKSVGVAFTTDGGMSWSEPGFIDLPNPDSAVDTVPLSGDRILLAFNDSAADAGRQNLCLAVSSDPGREWKKAATLERTPGEEFSYPFMINKAQVACYFIISKCIHCNIR